MGFEPVCGGGFCGDREGRAKASVTSAPDSRTTEEPRDYDLVLTSPGRAPGCVGLMGSGPGATAYVRWRRPATNLEAAACLVRVREAVEVSMVECECVGCGSDAESSRFKCGVLAVACRGKQEAAWTSEGSSPLSWSSPARQSVPATLRMTYSRTLALCAVTGERTHRAVTHRTCASKHCQGRQKMRVALG